MSSELAYMSAVELSRAIRAKQVSSVEITELFYQRIERLDPRLNSYLALCPEQALADARVADDAVARGWALGPLHGIPISIKDLEMSKGIPTTLGSALFRDRTPEVDSIVVERVKAAGAVVLGKTNTPEFGQSGTTENKVSDPCRNPWNTDRTPGGSSGGAGAALAAGLCTLATGSDGGGIHPHSGQLQRSLRHQADPAPRSSVWRVWPACGQSFFPVGPNEPYCRRYRIATPGSRWPGQPGPQFPLRDSARLQRGAGQRCGGDADCLESRFRLCGSGSGGGTDYCTGRSGVRGAGRNRRRCTAQAGRSLRSLLRRFCHRRLHVIRPHAGGT